MPVKRMRKQTDTNLLDLPSDVLLPILDRLNHEDHLALSQVSKSFCSLTNGFVHKLKFKLLPSNSAFRKIFARFSSVTRIAFHSTRIVRALTAIANSGLKIQGLEIYGKPSFPKPEEMASLSGWLGGVKALKLDGWFSKVRESQVVEFIHLFRTLEDLDLSKSKYVVSFDWSDVGIEKLALKCPNLRTINLNGNRELTSHSLDALLNCVNLERFTFEGCFKVNSKGMIRFLLKSQSLRVLVLTCELFYHMPEGDYLPLAEAILSCATLTHLLIKASHMKTAFQKLMAMLQSPSRIKGFKPELVIETVYSYEEDFFASFVRFEG